MGSATAGDGTELWWEATPGEPTVVLVPGRGDATDLYPSCFVHPLREAGLGVLRYDPRDTGMSGDGGDDDTLATMADDVLVVLDAAGVDRAVLVGVSMAGLLLVDVASRAPERVAALAFVSAMSPDPDAGMGPDFFAALDGDPLDLYVGAMGQVGEADRAWAAAELAAAEQRAPRRPDAVARHQEAAMRFGWPTPDLLADIDVPTVVVHGTDDRVLPVAHAEALATGIGSARLEVRDGMGHLPRPHDWKAIARLVASVAPPSGVTG